MNHCTQLGHQMRSQVKLGNEMMAGETPALHFKPAARIAAAAKTPASPAGPSPCDLERLVGLYGLSSLDGTGILPV